VSLSSSGLCGGDALRCVVCEPFLIPVSHNCTTPSMVLRSVALRTRAMLVPPAVPMAAAELKQLIQFITEAANTRGGLVCLTGAGVSTESGIPDYRSPGGAYSTGFKPMTYQEFMASQTSRERYWCVRHHKGP
jgi:hypothetical protein